jgi:2-keto-4-pentenoate hydratase/2-oxohepta-3-ene-1,7-dioic acid hydratase in catechol pathway
MMLLTFRHGDRIAIGALQGDAIVDLSPIAPDMLALIDMGPEALARVAERAMSAPDTLSLQDVTLLSPIPTPRRNVMCLGRNYFEHARESYEARGQAVELPTHPVIFTKATTTVNGPFDDVPVNPAVSEQMDYEVELAVIIGRRGKNIGRAEAMDFVFGYTVLNDITARDVQDAHKQFFKGKSLDGCCPIGPWIVTADAIPDPHALRLTCRVNDEVRQESNTSDMMFDIPGFIEILSRGMTLMPGDILATGTPAGVGFAMKPPVFLRPGDVVECSIESIGIIRNRIVLA